MKFFFSLLIISFFYQTYATANNSTIKKLASAVLKKSVSAKVIQAESAVTTALTVAELTIFHFNNQIYFNYLDQTSAPTSPFSPTKNRVNEYGIGLNKLWAIGVQSELKYSVKENLTEFDARPDFEYMSPTLSLNLSTDLIQDLIYSKNYYLFEKNKQTQEKIKVEANLGYKKILVSALLQVAQIIEGKVEFELQREFCEKTLSQYQKMKSKRDKRSVSLRDYLLSQKEYTQCQSLLVQLASQVEHLKIQFKNSFDISYNELDSINFEKLYSELISGYYLYKNKSNNLNVENLDEYKSLFLSAQEQQAKTKLLKAQSKTSIKLQVSTGLVGVEDNLEKANKQITDTEYPFVSVGVSMDWPWSANSKDWEYKASLIKEHSLIIQKQKKAEELKSVFSDLKRQIEDDLKIFEHNKKTVQLSKQVLNEGRKDFYNGRLDFINLTDIGKLYIQDQKKLSSLKLKLISNLVLFLDYFQYFNGYLMEN